MTTGTDNGRTCAEYVFVERIMSPQKTERLSASHAHLEETVEALKKSLKALNGTRIDFGSGVVELKQAIRDAIRRAETMIQHWRRKDGDTSVISISSIT